MSAEENKTTVRRLFEDVLTKGNTELAREIISPEYVGFHAPDGRLLSRQEVRQGGGSGVAFRAAFPDGTFTIDLLIAEGDFVAARWTFRGTHQREFREPLSGRTFPPTGKPIAYSGVNIYRFADGKIVENWLHAHDEHFLRQLGATITPPGQDGA